uniref:Secreted protein n=1 Tax=Strongyloides papillosus TaxID=174720 RepID=A0A0N5BHE4_STREA
MKCNVLAISICLAIFIMVAHGYLDIMPLKNSHDNEKINGKKLLYDFLKQDSLLNKSQYIPFSQLHLKYNNRGLKPDSGDIKRNERVLSLNDLQRLNIPIITNPKQTKYTRSNCFLSPVQCSFFLP